jgi:hypothetical protein
MAERLSPALKAVSDAVLAVAAELSVEDVLQRLVHSARELGHVQIHQPQLVRSRVEVVVDHPFLVRFDGGLRSSGGA